MDAALEKLFMGTEGARRAHRRISQVKGQRKANAGYLMSAYICFVFSSEQLKDQMLRFFCKGVNKPC